MHSTCYFCHILMKFEFSGLIVGKYSDIIFHGNPSPGSRVVPCVRTDGRTDDMTKLTVAVSQFWERA